LERVDGAPGSFVWFLAVGIYARQLAPTVLAMAIISTKTAHQEFIKSSQNINIDISDIPVSIPKQ
jgi:hypothetical protein